jgi:hypothetical protein
LRLDQHLTLLDAHLLSPIRASPRAAS